MQDHDIALVTHTHTHTHTHTLNTHTLTHTHTHTHTHTQHTHTPREFRADVLRAARTPAVAHGATPVAGDGRTMMSVRHGEGDARRPGETKMMKRYRSENTILVAKRAETSMTLNRQ